MKKVLMNPVMFFIVLIITFIGTASTIFPSDSSVLVNKDPVSIEELLSGSAISDFNEFVKESKITPPKFFVNRVFSFATTVHNDSVILPANYKELSEEQIKFILVKYVTVATMPKKQDTNGDNVYDERDKKVRILRFKKTEYSPEELVLIKKNNGILVKKINWWPLAVSYKKVTEADLNMSVVNYTDSEALTLNLKNSYKEILKKEMGDSVPNYRKHEFMSVNIIKEDYLRQNSYVQFDL